jgi:hypothetical protein
LVNNPGRSSRQKGRNRGFGLTEAIPWRCRTFLFVVADASSDETQVLTRNTLWPKQDFLVLPLEAEMVWPIMAAVGRTVPRGLIHVQIQKERWLQLGLYDNFAPEFMFFGPGLTPTFFATLQEAGALAHLDRRVHGAKS